MATLRISLDRKSGKVINKQFIDNGTKAPDMNEFFDWLAQHEIDKKGLDFFLNLKS